MPHREPRHSFSRKPLAMAMLGAALALQVGIIQPLGNSGLARADEAQRTYAIGAGPLGAVLSRFASESGVVLSFDARLTQDLHSPGLQGSYGIEQGFAQLLRGNALQISRSSNGDYLLLPRNSSAALELGATNIEANGLGATTEGTGSYTTGRPAPRPR